MISKTLQRVGTTVLAGVMAAGAAAFGPSAPPARANTSWVEAFACTQGISIFVVEDNPAFAAPRVAFGLRGGEMRDAKRIGEVSGPAVPGGGAGRQYIYWSETALPANVQGIVTAFGQTNESYGSFTVSATCPALGSVRGNAFEDRNANGLRDAGEGVINIGWWKLTAGGDWHICGYAGGDGTFGPTVKPGTFTLLPIAPPGWRATSAPRTVLIRKLGDVSLNNDIGFVRDARAKGDVCGQYQPQPSAVFATPAPAGRSLADMLAASSGASNATFATLLAAGHATGVFDQLTDGQPYTVFAPTDAAFARVPKRSLDRLIASPQSLAAVLRCHIALSHVPPPAAGVTQRVRTLCGRTVLVHNAGRTLRVAGRSAVAPVTTDFGVVYPIDALLTLRGR